MNFTAGTSFAEFKADFYGKTSDLSLYDCGEINIVKVVLDGLKVNYTSRGAIRTPFFFPGFFWNLHQALQRKKQKPGGIMMENKVAKILVADLSGRSESERNEKPVSYYFDKLMEQHAPNECVHVVEYFKKPGYPHDADLRDHFFLQYTEQGAYDKKLRQDLLLTYKRLQKSALFDAGELANIRIAIQSFYSQFRIWNELLTYYPNLQYAVLEQHYHHEGLLLALKRRNIKSYEIQHGLVAGSDIFYVFPKELAPVRERALFPDKILTYGSYWKETLMQGSEFTAEQIVITGDFRQKNKELADAAEKKRIDTFSVGSKIILVTSQTFMQDHYSAYVRQLSALIKVKHPGWKIILKIHPNEKPETYAPVEEPGHVLVTKANMLYLFQLAVMHISVYSTTLFDALEYPLANFSLQCAGYEDYTDAIVRDHIAQPLYMNEDPIEKFERTGTVAQADAARVSAPFASEIYQKLFVN